MTYPICGHVFRKVDYVCSYQNCTSIPEFTLTAAYPAEVEIHPRWATYPAPMARLCGEHIGFYIDEDTSHDKATQGYLIRKIENNQL